MKNHSMNILILAMLLVGCNKPTGGGQDPVGPGGEVTHVTTITSDLCWSLSTDKAMYKPGQTVQLVAEGDITNNTRVRYRNGSRVISDEPLTSTRWSWTAPGEDGVGYMVEVYRRTNDTTQQIIGTIGVDVSSDWSLFPRYGFVATFDRSKTSGVIAQEMAYLNRCHINGVQFQDWHYKHHWPAPVKNGQVMESFTDIANRINQTEVIRQYIDVQHGYGMKSIFYNLAFGALDDAGSDGVKEEWYMFKDQHHGDKDYHGLPSSWKSNIYLIDPGNKEWQAYLADRNEEVYSHFAFDGYQIDQLGYRGDRYTYKGSKINFNNAYASFIRAMKERHPDKDLIMNAVSSYCAQGILQTGQTMLAYNECWGDEADFQSLYNVVKANDAYSSGAVKTVFACYMDYELDNCEFNVPGVLLTDAVMFALGGSHLELGDHMLCREYFPYTGVRMSASLREQIIRYYDFLTAYENLLRGGGEEEKLVVTSENSKVSVVAWPPKLGKVATFGRNQGGKHVLHLLNFQSADQLSWRDMKGTMPAPRVVRNLPLAVDMLRNVSHVYVASPDQHAGAWVELPFVQKDGKVRFTVPQLKYWDMIVIE